MTGYASEAVAVQIEKLSLTTDLYVSVSQPGYINGCRMPVTIDVFKAFTWAGDTAIDEEKGYFIELVHFEEDCSPLAFQELRQACYISVIDLCWGRKDYLWDELAKALCSHRSLIFEVHFQELEVYFVKNKGLPMLFLAQCGQMTI